MQLRDLSTLPTAEPRKLADYYILSSSLSSVPFSDKITCQCLVVGHGTFTETAL